MKIQCKKQDSAVNLAGMLRTSFVRISSKRQSTVKRRNQFPRVLHGISHGRSMTKSSNRRNDGKNLDSEVCLRSLTQISAHQEQALAVASQSRLVRSQ